MHDDPLGLVGLYVHIGDDKNPCVWQGQIVGYDSHAQLVILELFSWMTGEANGLEVHSVYETRGWSLYRTAQDMQNAYLKIQNR